MASVSSPSPSTHIPYPNTIDLKSARGTFHKLLKKKPPYRFRRHSRVTFTGTVKVHGTNITIIVVPNQSIYIQSRNHVISPDADDGYGSAAWVQLRIENICEAFKPIVKYEPKEVMIAGEFAGKGINPMQAATSDLERFYVVFGFRVDGIWVDRSEWEHVRFDTSARVFNIHEFKRFNVVVDFDEERTIGGGKKMDELSLGVEKQCPVALQLGGIQNGLGEGIVWIEERDGRGSPRHPLRVKSKGPRFASVGKLAPSELVVASGVEVELTEKANRFVEYAVTVARLEQGVEYIRAALTEMMATESEVCTEQIFCYKEYINQLSLWVQVDVWKEELDELTKLGLYKGVGKAQVHKCITQKVKEFFLAHQEAPRVSLGFLQA